jgi:hypothetical protein
MDQFADDNYKVEEDEVGGTCGTDGREEERVKVIGRKARGKETTRRPRCKWMDNIKMDLSEIGLNVVDWIGLAQDRYRWRALVNSVMNFRDRYNAGNYRVAAQLVASRAVLSSTELVSYGHCWKMSLVQLCYAQRVIL